MSKRYQGGILGVGFNPLQAPNAPTIGTATPLTSTTASVAFTAPANVGGGAITGYLVISSPGNINATGSSSPITVSGLSLVGTAYTFRVTALNSFGPSPISAASNSVIADFNPDAFSFTNATGIEPSTVTTSNTITPTGYTLATTWSVTNGGTASINGGAYASSGTISPGQTITVRGTSSSSYSTGVSFLVSIGTTQSTWTVNTRAQPTEALYFTPGTYSFIVPSFVTNASVISVGGGAGGGGGNYGNGGGGGGLNWRNNISLTPGQSIAITVGAGGAGTFSSPSNGLTSVAAFPLECTASGAVGNNGGGRSAPSGGGGNGGQGNQGGGGAAGYSGNGGSGGSTGGSGNNGAAGGAGGGGGGSYFGNIEPNSYAGRWSSGGGGGVGVDGQGSSGTGGSSSGPGTGGGGGSGGNPGSNAFAFSDGGAGSIFGGGGGRGGYYYYVDGGGNPEPTTYLRGGNGGNGVVRIIWPGTTRQFPSTNVGPM